MGPTPVAFLECKGFGVESPVRNPYLISFTFYEGQAE